MVRLGGDPPSPTTTPVQIPSTFAPASPQTDISDSSTIDMAMGDWSDPEDDPEDDSEDDSEDDPENDLGDDVLATREQDFEHFLHLWDGVDIVVDVNREDEIVPKNVAISQLKACHENMTFIEATIADIKSSSDAHEEKIKSLCFNLPEDLWNEHLNLVRKRERAVEEISRWKTKQEAMSVLVFGASLLDELDFDISHFQTWLETKWIAERESILRMERFAAYLISQKSTQREQLEAVFQKEREALVGEKELVIQALKSQLSTMKNQHQNDFNMWLSTTSDLESKLKQSQQEILNVKSAQEERMMIGSRELTTQNSVLKETLRRSQEEVGVLEDEIIALQRTITYNSIELAAVSDIVKAQRLEVDRLLARKRADAEEQQKLQEAYDELAKKYEASELQNESYKIILPQMEKGYNEKCESYERLQEQHNSLQEEHEQTIGNMDEPKKLHLEAEQQVQQANSLIKSYKEQLQSSTKKVVDSLGKVKEMRAIIKTLSALKNFKADEGRVTACAACAGLEAHIREVFEGGGGVCYFKGQVSETGTAFITVVEDVGNDESTGAGGPVGIQQTPSGTSSHTHVDDRSHEDEYEDAVMDMVDDVSETVMSGTVFGG